MMIMMRLRITMLVLVLVVRATSMAMGAPNEDDASGDDTASSGESLQSLLYCYRVGNPCCPIIWWWKMQIVVALPPILHAFLICNCVQF